MNTKRSSIEQQRTVSLQHIIYKEYLELFGGEGGQAGAYGVAHGLRVLALGQRVQEPPVPEVYRNNETRFKIRL